MTNPIPTSTDRPWEGDRDLSLREAQDLIEDQFPSLAPVSIRLHGRGWDNTAFEVNQALLFRFPRREVAVLCMETEIALLPRLQHLPLPVPNPLFVGRAGSKFPWPWAGYERVPGTPLYRELLQEEARADLAEIMGAFVASLHATPVDASWNAPPDLWKRFDLSRRVPQIHDYAGRLKSMGFLPSSFSYAHVLDAVGDLPPWDRAALTHADLDSRHWLVSKQSLTGVIDWGDLHLGNPAVDCIAPWALLPRDAREAFWRGYGEASPELRAWSRFRALNQCVVTAVYGAEIDDADLLRESLASLARLVID